MRTQTTRTPALRVFLNPHSCGGAARLRWERMAPALRRRLGPFHVEEIREPHRLTARVAAALKRGETTLLAAGGDGTVHLLLNALMSLSVQAQQDGNHVTLGAVGLGSSNDFHKPFSPDRLLGRIPIRVERTPTRLQDVLRIAHQDDAGSIRTRFSLINASVGLTAEGNALFNTGGRWIRAARTLSTSAAIMLAALGAVLKQGRTSLQLTLDQGESETLAITTLGVFKNPHFAGSLCYDTAVPPDCGRFGVAYCHDLTVMERVRMLLALRTNRFSHQPKTVSRSARQLTVTSDTPFTLEIDGETFPTEAATFSVIPRAVRCCS